jgi:AmpE protein
MFTFSLIIALVLDRIFTELQDYRTFRWLGSYYQWLVDNWKIDKFGFWPAAGIILFSVLLLVGLLDGLFNNAFFGLFELAFYVLIAALCLGPRSLDRDIDVYLDSLTADDSQQQSTAAELFGVDTENIDASKQIDQVAGNIFVMANRGLYSVVFWLVLAGPLAVVAYRLIERLAMLNQFSGRLGWQSRATQIMAWMEWAPTLLSSFAFMVSGSFDAGFSRSQQLPVFGPDVDRVNHRRLHQVGMACSGIDTENGSLHSIDKIKKVRGLILRSLVVWIAFAGLFELLI